MARRKPPKIAANAEIIGIARKSEEDNRRQVMSLKDQRKLITDYYMSHFTPEVRAAHPLRIVETAQSGFVPGLPTIDEVCAMAAQGKIYCTLAVTVTRIGRNHTDLGRFTQDLADGFIPFFETVEGKRYTKEDTGTIIMLCLEGAIGWHDSAEKSKVVKQRMTLRAKEGKHMGRKPFGFKPNRYFTADGYEVRETVIDDERLLRVIEMYRMAATGTYSLTDLEAWAEEEEIRARPTKNNPTGELYDTAIAHILHDPYFKGEVWFDEKFQGKWTDNPPVSEALWIRVQLAMLDRCTNTARIKKESLRKLFTFGSVIRCGKCRKSTVSPYKVSKKNGTTYVYYACMNKRTRCKETITQPILEQQHKQRLTRLHLGEKELESVRQRLLGLYNERSKQRGEKRESMNKEYEDVEREIREQLSNLKKAEDMGVGKEAEDNITQLRLRRDELKAKLDGTHEEGSAWIEKVIKCFELVKLAEEAIRYGSPHVREAMLKAIGSNYTLTDGKLLVDWRSPFKEAFEREGRSEWWAILDSNQ